MVHMDPTQPTTGTPTGTTRWALPAGLLAGVGVMGLVLAILEVLDPASDAAVMVPLLGIPAALIIAALVPAWRGRFLGGMALASLMALFVLIGLLLVFWGGA
jgi:hypothetical protein